MTSLAALESAGGDRGKLRPITALAGFNLDVFLEQPPPATVEVVGDGGSLRLQAETGADLTIGTDSQVASRPERAPARGR
jgi:hypothetical protein